VDTLNQVVANVNPVLITANQDLAELKPLEIELTNSEVGISTLVNNPEIAQTITAIHGTADASNSAAKSVQHVADYYDHVFTDKKPWYKKIWPVTIEILEGAYYGSNINFKR
jgi:hypothetical protein